VKDISEQHGIPLYILNYLDTTNSGDLFNGDFFRREDLVLYMEEPCQTYQNIISPDNFYKEIFRTNREENS
jgi:hypothetical protein